MWVGDPQIVSNIYNIGFMQGLTSPLLLKAPIDSNIGWGLFLWLSPGLRTGSRMAEHPLFSTFAESGHGNGPDRKRRLRPLRSASVPAAQSGYTGKSSDMKLGEKSRFRK